MVSSPDENNNIKKVYTDLTLLSNNNIRLPNLNSKLKSLTPQNNNDNSLAKHTLFIHKYEQVSTTRALPIHMINTNKVRGDKNIKADMLLQGTKPHTLLARW